jgi:uncharacterized protein YukE
MVDLTEVTVDQLTEFFESIVRDAMRDHEKRFADRIRSIKETASNLGNVSTRFETAVRQAWGTMENTTSEYGTRMAQTLQELSQTLSQGEASPTYQDAEQFHRVSLETLNKIIKTVRKYLPKLHRGLKAEMAALNSALGKLEIAVRSLGSALEESPGSKIESMRRDVQSIIQRRTEIVRLRAEEKEQATSLESITHKEADLQTAEKQLASQDAFLELNRYEDSLKAKEEQIKQFFQPVVKPLVKLDRTASTNQNQTIDSRTLRSIVERPVETVTTGQPFALIQLFTQLDEALAHGRLEVEERRRRRAEETIQQVKRGAAERMREDYLTIQANIQETLRQLKAVGLLDKKTQIEELLSNARKDKENLTFQMAELQRKINDTTRGLQRHKSSLEDQIAMITKKTVTIRADY